MENKSNLQALSNACPALQNSKIVESVLDIDERVQALESGGGGGGGGGSGAGIIIHETFGWFDSSPINLFEGITGDFYSDPLPDSGVYYAPSGPRCIQVMNSQGPLPPPVALKIVLTGVTGKGETVGEIGLLAGGQALWVSQHAFKRILGIDITGEFAESNLVVKYAGNLFGVSNYPVMQFLAMYFNGSIASLNGSPIGGLEAFVVSHENGVLGITLPSPPPSPPQVIEIWYQLPEGVQ